jgi:4-hydroxy-4-methyl-2-oxoglutarate aldolase
MIRNFQLVASVALILLFAGEGRAQLGMFSKEQRIEFTREWKGERAEDGRPLVPDSVLERLKNTTAEEAWGVLRGARYPNQFTAGFQQIVTVPGKRLVGRAVTAVFMPVRPDINAVINEKAKAEGRGGAGGQNSWVIDTLKPGDVVVVDLFGKIKDGTFIGDNLATSIFAKTGTGVVVDGSVRDLSGISQIKGFTGYVRGFDPSAIANVMLVGINVPIRIGETTVMPGDVVLGDPEGITFVPAQLAEKLADVSEDIQLRDEWGHTMLREGKYTPGQIDSRWSPEMQAEFKKWSEEQKAKRRK